MRPRHAILALALIAGLSACGSSSNATGSGTKTSAPPVQTPNVTVPTNGIHLDCAKYAQTAAQVSQTAAKMFTGTVADFRTAAGALEGELGALKSGAPTDVKAAIDDLNAALAAIVNIREKPTSSAESQHLQALLPKFPADGAKISAYIASTCHS